MIHADEACLLDVNGNFFEAFTGGRIPGILVVVDESAGQAPQASARFDSSAAQQNSAFDLDHHRRGDFGVVPQDEVVIGTGLDFAAFDSARHELGAAVDAVVAQGLSVLLRRRRFHVRDANLVAATLLGRV